MSGFQQRVRSALVDEQNSPRKKPLAGCCCCALIVSIILIAVSLRKISSTELGVEYDTWAKKLDDAATSDGLHTGPPGFEFIKFPSTQITAEVEDTCVSRDGLRVNFQVSYQYLMPERWIVGAIKKYRDFPKWGKIVQAAGVSAIQNSCAMFNITSFQSLRNVIQKDMFDQLKQKLEGSTTNDREHDGVFAQAISLQLKNVNLPAEYTNTISEKQSAQEDITLAVNQRRQEITKANTEFFAAKDEARKLIAKARNDVNVTLTAAHLTAQQTEVAFEMETLTIVQAKENFGLDEKGVLSYLANQLYATAPSLSASIREPAKISLKEEL